MVESGNRESSMILAAYVRFFTGVDPFKFMCLSNSFHPVHGA